jgi:hypothetical protein
MGALSIVLTSLTISSILWIVTLLLLGRHKLIEEVSDHSIDEMIYIPDEIDNYDLPNNPDAQSLSLYDIDNEMITVAVTNIIKSRQVSKQFAFSIN